MQVFDYVPCFMQDTAVAMGFFDGVHIGHKQVLQNAVCGKYLPVALTFKISQGYPEGKKNMLFLNTVEQKCAMINNIGIENIIMPEFEKMQKMDAEVFFEECLVKRLNAKQLICGENFRFGVHASGTVELLIDLAKRHNIEVCVVDLAKSKGEVISSSRIRKALVNGDLKLASSLLGYEYWFRSEVVYGNRYGRKLGYPTINQNFPREVLIPKNGVYASEVQIDDIKYLGVTNIGVRPSLNSLKRPIAETYIIDYSGESLYGKDVIVKLLKYIRKEKNFDSLKQLVESIKDSVELVKNML